MNATASPHELPRPLVSRITINYRSKPLRKPSRSSDQRRAAASRQTVAAAVVAPTQTPANCRLQSKREFLHVEAHCLSHRCCLQRAGHHRDRHCACPRRGKDRHGRRRRDVSVEEHRPECRQLEGPHHAGGGGEGGRPRRDAGRQGPVHGVRADQHRLRQAAGRHRRHPGQAREQGDPDQDPHLTMSWPASSKPPTSPTARS